MENKYYVYSHIRPSNGKVFYIGRGGKNRAFEGGRNNAWADIVREEGGFNFKILVNNISLQKSKELEKSFVNQVGYEHLTNHKHEVKSNKVSRGFAGKRHTPEAKERIRQANIARHVGR